METIHDHLRLLPEIFYYVAQYKSFTKAARALHNNQPNNHPLYEQPGAGAENVRSSPLPTRESHYTEGRQLYEHVALAFEQLSIGEEEIR